MATTERDRTRPTVKVLVASTAGTVVEWYDFFVYGTAAALVFGTVFFPNAGSQLTGIIAALGTYAVGFVARPIGGVVFGPGVLTPVGPLLPNLPEHLGV